MTGKVTRDEMAKKVFTTSCTQLSLVAVPRENVCFLKDHGKHAVNEGRLKRAGFPSRGESLIVLH